MTSSDSNPNPPSNDAIAGQLNPTLRAALAQLQQAQDYARDVAADPYEFAVEIERLIALGLTTSDLRWLAKKGWIQHLCEVTEIIDPARRFEHCENLAFTSASCFLLTESASAFTRTLEESAEMSRPTTVPQPAGPSQNSPHWDTEDRTLYVGQQIVKAYRVRSPNQEAVLAAFEEEQWPRCIDDPLSPSGDQNPKQRLRDTIKCLNANQKNHLIRFRGDGTGERVRWEWIDNASTHANHAPN
jgi:hypothetical protein